jgi:hypothetical protein
MTWDSVSLPNGVILLPERKPYTASLWLRSVRLYWWKLSVNLANAAAFQDFSCYDLLSENS